MPDQPDPFAVPCPSCHAIAGEQCRNQFTGGPLVRFTAHPARLKAAEK